MSDDRRGRQDDRTRHTTRAKPVDSAQERASREREDDERQESATELSLADREMLVRTEAMQNLLPTPPRKPGIHYVYLSLQNPSQIGQFIRWGYKPVKMTEMPGWAEAQAKTGSGDYAGCITVNEMVLFKIDERSYQAYMKILHHEKPNEEQGTVNSSVDAARVATEEAGEGRTQVVDVNDDQGRSGLKEMRKVRPAPKSFQ